MDYIAAGKIVNTHGIKGEVKIKAWLGDINELARYDKLYFDAGKTELNITRARVHADMVLAKIEGIDDMTAAESLKNKEVYILKDAEVLGEGEYYIEDILGLEVVDADTSESYGKITDVYQGPANDAYEIELKDGRRVLFPVIKQVVLETDLENKTMKIRPLLGMFDI